MLCSDTDLLRWEPNIALDAEIASQALLTASGAVAGTTLTLASGSFVESRVSAGLIACLRGAIEGCFPIVSVDSASTCTLSVLYDGLDQTPAVPVSPGSAASLNVTIRSFYPQRRIISDLLTRMAGVDSAAGETLLNVEDFTRPCALGALHLIYMAISTAATEQQADLVIRAELYERLYRKSLRSLIAEIDTDGDGEVDRRQALHVVRLARV